jgi:hypothetical protein
MSSTTENDKGVIFSNQDSGNASLFINTSAGLSIWSALLLPEDSAYYQLTRNAVDQLQSEGVPAEVTDKLVSLIGQYYSSKSKFDTAVGTVLDEEDYHQYIAQIEQASLLKEMTIGQGFINQGYFLFAPQAPESSQLETFINQVKNYLQPFRTSAGSTTMAWLSEVDASKYTKSNVLVLGFIGAGVGGIKVSQTFSYQIGKTFDNSDNAKVFANITIVNNTKVSANPADSSTELVLAYNSNSPNLFFSSTSFGSGTLVNQDVSIPFSGAGCGSIRMPLGLNVRTDYKAFDLNTKYFYEGNDGTTSYQYPLLKEATKTQYLLCKTAIAPLDVLNKKGLNTYFALTGLTLDEASGNQLPTSIPSNFIINTGQGLILYPKVSWEEADNYIPTSYGARFVISPQDQIENLRFYLQPEGDFFMQPEQNQQADENGQFDFLPGLGGTEFISFTPYSVENEEQKGDTLRFKSGQSAYAPEFPAKELSLTNPGEDKQTLSNRYLTSWASIVSSVAENNQYSSQPEGASLYAKDQELSEWMAKAGSSGKATMLGFFEPTVNLPQSDGFAFPMAPYLGLQTNNNNADAASNFKLSTFESQVLSKERKARINSQSPKAQINKSARRRQRMLANAADGYTSSTSPQGLIAHVNHTDASWSLLNLAQNTIEAGTTSEYLYPENQPPDTPSQYQLSFINLSDTLKNGFLTNQQFLVVTQPNHLGELFSQSSQQGGTGTAAAFFNNKMSIEEWPFDLNVGLENQYADYKNVLIFKFCEGTILDRVKNPKIWTQPNTFNTEGTEDTSQAYQQLIAISSWLQAYLQEAEDAYQYGKAHPETNQELLFQKFHDIINDPNWNGILSLKVDINLNEFPQQLKGLISGINLQNFNAHHFGVEINKIDASGPIKMEKNSSLFGLINYLDPAYVQQLAQGLNPEKPIPPVAGATYDFKVLQLQVLFENTAIKFFQSKVQLTMNELFSDTVIGTNNPYGAKDINTVVLNGTYQDHNGTPVYIFENTDDNLFYFNSNLLKNVEITKIQFNTLTTDPNATFIESAFTMWGYLNFAVMQSTLSPPGGQESVTTVLDAFSFGNSDGESSDIMKGLNYSNLLIDMAFDINTPTVVTYEFNASKIVFNSGLSTSRPHSLYPNFALQINNLVSGNGDSKPSKLGYLTLGIPGINATGLKDNWYGLEMTLNMGTPGELAAALDFNASLLITWSPGAKATDSAYNALIGIKLPGTSSNAKLLSLQGILKLSIDTLKLEYLKDAPSPSYLLTLGNIALKFLGILKLPPGGSTNFLLFGNPAEGATAKSLGWYASYNKTQS